MERHTECKGYGMSNFNDRRSGTDERTGKDRRVTKDRRVEQVTYGTGQPLTPEEIAAAEAAPTCEACGIIHVGRECKKDPFRSAREDGQTLY